MKKSCNLKKIVSKIKNLSKPEKKVLVERRKADRRKSDRRWIGKLYNDPNQNIHRSQDRRIGERRKS